LEKRSSACEYRSTPVELAFAAFNVAAAAAVGGDCGDDHPAGDVRPRADACAST
jgi:hypothetical protein